MKKAIRFRKNDIVQGNDIRTGNWIIGRVILKGQQTVGVLDNTNHEWVLNIAETFKASRREFDEWTPESNRIEVQIDAGANVSSLVTETPPVESETPSAANMAEDMVEDEEDTSRDNADDEDDEDDEDDHSVLIKPDHTRYVTTKDISTASGRASYDIGDAVAQKLRGLPWEDVFEIVAMYMNDMEPDRGITYANLCEKYGHLNPGMKRMNAANMLRAAMKRNGVETL